MNSSGIKRGLAGSAVAALAVTGLPFLASSADAAAGDVMQVGSVGPTRNGGDVGGVVVLKTKNITAGELGNLKLFNTALTSTNPNTPNQTVAFVGGPSFVADGAAGDSNKTDGFDEVTVHVAVTTPAAGDTAHYAVVLDDNNNNTVEAGEARTQVDQSTAGDVDKVVVTPGSQSTAQGIESGDYTVSLQDSAGRTTQLKTSEEVDLSTTTDITLDPNNLPAPGLKNEGVLDSAALELGSATFTATPDGNAATGSHTITVDGPGTADSSATLVVTPAANISSANMVDIVTGADSWDGFGGGSLGGTTAVRVDQTSVRIDIKGSTPGGTVTLNVNGDKTASAPQGATDVTFGGKKSTTVSTVLDANGNGSLTITPDQFSVQDGDKLQVTGSFNQEIDFERAAPTTVEAAQDPYFGALKGSVDIEVSVLDQFGDPYTSGFVGAQRVAGPNDAQASPTLKPVEADGTTTFTFTDTKATNGDSDTIALMYFADQFSNSPDATGSTHIKWTTDGQGANFVTTIGGDNTEAATYDPATHTVIPLADASDDSAAEHQVLNVTGGEPNATATISVDNGALILAPGKTALSDGKSEITVTLDGAGNLPASVLVPNTYRLVGTKAGLTTVTVSAANRTETSKFTVSAQNDKSKARNVTVSGPATVPNGTTQIPFTAVVTDAFGNPVANVPVTDLNIQVTGPAQFQDSDAITNANGELNLNVRVDAGAEGDVTIKVQGFGEQFGAAADQLTASSPANSAKGLPASSNVGTATSTVESAPTPKESINLMLSGKSKGKKDVVKANADDNAAGLVAKLFKNGKMVKSHALNDSGDWTFTVKDKNGNKKTKYQVKVAATDTTKAGKKSISIK